MAILKPYFNNELLLDNNKPIMFDTSIMLTYPGATHTEEQVVEQGGFVYTIPSGQTNSGKTFGAFSTIPSGWTQAGTWTYYAGLAAQYDYCNVLMGDAILEGWSKSTKAYWDGDGMLYNKSTNCEHLASIAGANRSIYWAYWVPSNPYGDQLEAFQKVQHTYTNKLYFGCI